MHCPSCGELITSAETKTCPRCGLPLPAPIPAAATDDIPAASSEHSAIPYAYGPYYGPFPPPFASPFASPYGPGVPGAPAPSSSALPMGYGPSGPYGPYAPPTGYPGYPYMPAGGIPSALPGAGQEIAPIPASRRNRFLIAGNIALILVLLVVGSIGWIAYFTTRNSNNASLIQSGATSTPVANVTATPSPTIIFQDPLTSNTYGWADDGINCFFQAGSYHTKGYVCLAPLTTPVADATVSVQVKQVGGPHDYPFGIVVRHASRGNFYDFVIASTGDWASFLHTNGKVSYLHPYTFNSAIHPGLNATNSLKVVMQGSNFRFYVNDTLVGQVTNSSFSSGSVGITSSGPSGGTPVDAAFNNFEVDQNG